MLVLGEIRADDSAVCVAAINYSVSHDKIEMNGPTLFDSCVHAL